MQTEVPPTRSEDPSLAEFAEQAEVAKAAEAAKVAKEGKEEEVAAGEQTKQTEAAAGDQAGEAEPAEQEEDDAKAVVKYLDEQFGLKESAKYADDHEFLRSVSELIRKVGSKDEDSELGKKVREKLGDDGLAKLLTAAAQPADGEPKKDAVDWDSSWLLTNEKGETAFAPHAPKDVGERFKVIQGRLHKMLADPEAFLQEAMKPHLEKLSAANKQTREEIAADKESMAVDGWCEKHRTLLYVDGDPGKGLTPQGEEVAGWVDDKENAVETPRLLTRLKYAAEFVLAKQPKTKTRLTPGRAKRTPDVAAKGKTAKTDEERFRAGESLADVLREKAGIED